MALHNIIEMSFGAAWRALLNQIIIEGDHAAPRDQPTLELHSVSLTVIDGLQNVLVNQARNLNYRFMVAEWLWIVAGLSDVATLAKYNKNIANYSDDGLTMAGAYGPRLRGQWAYLEQTLKKTDTRQAVMVIFPPNPPPSKDISCTLSLQYLIRKNLIGKKFVHCVVTMRSSDTWLGLPYDFFTFSMILNLIATRLKVEVGAITFNLGSSHLFEINTEQALAALRVETTTIRSAQLNIAGEVESIAEATLKNNGGTFLDQYGRILHQCENNQQALEVLRGKDR